MFQERKGLSQNEGGEAMINFYTWTSPNGEKVQIALEELGLPYQRHPVDLGKGEQRDEAFLEISPNGRIPAIVDPEGPDGKEIRLFESGAILLYLAEKAGELLPAEPGQRWQAVQWLMLQMSGVGPMQGQLVHFMFSAPEPVPYAVERYLAEVERLYGVLDRRLGEAEYLAESYSVADIACFPFVRRHPRFGLDLEGFPNLARWLEEIGKRPAVARVVEG